MGPSVILYIKEKILDIQRFCLKDDHVLTFDKTFNLGSLHVTVGVLSLSIYCSEAKQIWGASNHDWASVSTWQLIFL